jgi:hypothetical protein
MTNDFYYRFEQRFRGSREEIKRRQSVYLPILEPLSPYSPLRAPLILAVVAASGWS